MKKKRWILLTLVIGAFALITGATWNLSAKTAEAACGASTSSCKTCHEVKGEDPVAKKGDWHVQHAFGDFCQACHLGAATENDKTKAHAGMIANPLTQSEQTCASCHPSDTAARVAKYGGASTGGSGTAGGAGSSGSSGGSGGSSAPGGANAPTSGANNVTASPAAAQIPPSANPNFDLIDFNKYARSPSSWIAWGIGLLDGFILLVVLILIWRWKKGIWLWTYFKRKGNWINLSDFPVEAQHLIKRLLRAQTKTVLEMARILDTWEAQAEKDEAKMDHKGGKDHVL